MAANDWMTNKGARQKALGGAVDAASKAAEAQAMGMNAGRAQALQRGINATPMNPGAGAAGSLGNAYAAGAAEPAKAAADASRSAATSAASTELGAQSAQRGLDANADARNAAEAQEARTAAETALGRDLRKKLVDDQMAFHADERGRSVMNERQLTDWAMLKAKSGDELKTYAQEIQQATQDKLMMMDAAYQKIAAALDFEQKKRGNQRNHDTEMALAKAKAEMEAAIKKKQAEAANTMKAFQTGGQVIGGVVGGVFGGSAGAAVGMAAGSAVGSAAGSQYVQATT